MTTRDDISAAVNDVLRTKLGRSGFETAEVRTGADHAGEPALFIFAHFSEGSAWADAEASADVRTALRLKLLDLGEERFPYLRFRYTDDEVLVGEGQESAG